MVCSATEPRARDEAYNITNGDVFRWERLWPRFAEFFALPFAPPEPVRLAEVMRGRDEVWDSVVAKHGLSPYRRTELVDWAYVDEEFHNGWNLLVDNNKRRRLGFHGWDDS